MAKKTAARISPTRDSSPKAAARDLPKKAAKDLSKKTKTASKGGSAKKATVVVAPPRKAKTAPKSTAAPTRPKVERTSPPKGRTAPKKKTTARAPAAAPPELREAPAVPPPASPRTGGTIVGGTDPCTCGDAPEEHGRDPRYPGSTGCNVPGCECVAYEADPADSEAATPDPESHEAAAEAGPESPKTHTSDPGFGEEDSGDEDPEY